MPIVEIGSLDAGGLVLDKPKYDLMPNVFTNGYNIEFNEKGVTPANAFVQSLQGLRGSPLRIDILQILASQRLVVYLTAEDAYCVYRGKSAKITRASGPYSADATFKWSGGFFHGQMIYTNGRDVPQAYAPTGPTQKFVDLPNWPSSIRVRLMKPFMNFLVGLGYNNATEREYDSQTVFWSDVADPGTLPKWDITDPAQKAGTYSLTETKSAIIAAEVLGTSLAIYKEDSVYLMQYIGGTYVFNFTKVLDGYGAASANSIVAIGTEHFVVGQNDLYTFNGVSQTPIGQGYIREFLFKDWNPIYRHNVFCLHREALNQIWICYPRTNREYANRALIWNYVKNTWTIRELPNVYCGAYSYTELYGQLGSWAAMANNTSWSPDLQWDLVPDDITWANAGSTGLEKSLYFGVAYTAGDSPSVVVTDTAFTYSGITWSKQYPYPPLLSIPFIGEKAMGYIERTNLAVDGKDQNGVPSVDRTIYKTVTECYPEVDGSPLKIRFGTQTVHNGTVDWSDWMDYDPSVDYKLDPFVTEKFIAIAFQSNPENAGDWTLTGYSLNILNGGRY